MDAPEASGAGLSVPSAVSAHAPTSRVMLLHPESRESREGRSREAAVALRGVCGGALSLLWSVPLEQVLRLTMEESVPIIRRGVTGFAAMWWC